MAEKVEAKKLSKVKFMVEKTGGMKVPVIIFASEKIVEALKQDGSLQQGINVATLPGICKASIMMPDAHYGYGFSIGGVAAFDSENGIITPGGIGFDINCGVRMLVTDLMRDEVEPRIVELLDSMYKNVPVGVGSESKIRLTHEELDRVLKKGARWAVEKGYGTEEDIQRTESYGSLEQADSAKVSPKAKARGKNQLGTLGAGNHFLEVQEIDEIFDPKLADVFGIRQKGQVVIMIHCGSRGLGHQVCSDYIRKMEEAYPDIMKSLPEKDLIYAPIKSQLAMDYFAAMCASANYAWVNRHIIAHEIRKSLKQIFGERKIDTLYDVAHNIAKLEEHIIDGEKKKVYLHRKGATRAFPPGHPELPSVYKESGQPIIIPGSMGTASYVLVGTETAMQETFGSTAHGAGRAMSRHAALHELRGEQVKRELESRKIHVKAGSMKGLAEEAPAAYKDIDEIVRISHEAGIGNLVARVRPFGVIKG